MILKSLVPLTIFVTLAGCDIPRPSKVVCDCHIKLLEESSDWAPLDQAPANFVHSEIRQLYNDPESDYIGTPELFDAASIHWYQNEAEESLACIVFDGSNDIRATFILSADIEQTSPIDALLTGRSHGRERFFWEGCVW